MYVCNILKRILILRNDFYQTISQGLKTVIVPDNPISLFKIAIYKIIHMHFD